MHPWLAAHALKAFNTTSTILCDVNTFPAQTAAVGDGMSRDFFGILTTINRVSLKKVTQMQGPVRTSKGNETAGVEWDVTVEHRAHAVDNSRVYDRRRGVEVVPNFGSGTLEIEYSRTILLTDLDPELNLSASQFSTIIIRENTLTGVPSSK